VAALELFCLAGNALEWPVWQNLFNAYTGGITDMLGQSEEGLFRVTV
jgi:acyl-coenzyme A synthetase/AMP-(fatty) acid ligase